MPKMKTNRAARKRFKVTGSGKIVHRHSFASHLYQSKSRPRQVRLKKDRVVAGSDTRAVRRLLGT